MNQYTPHQWERDVDLMGWRCEKPPITLRGSEYCPGCELFIGDEEVARFSGWESINGITSAVLNWLAMQKGRRGEPT